RQLPAGVNLQELQLRVLVAGGVGAKGELTAVRAWREPRDGREPRRIYHLRVDEQTLLASEAIAVVDARLLLITVPPEVEVPPTALDRLGHEADLQQRPDAIFQRLATWQPV